MAVIEECVYQSGQLMAPSFWMTLQAKHRLRERSGKYFPTFDIGYTHIFRIIGWGLSDQRAEQEALRKVKSFFRKMNQVEGFSTLGVKKDNGYIPVNENYSYTYEITYVIERTSSFQNPYSPYPEYKQDLKHYGFAPETAKSLGL